MKHINGRLYFHISHFCKLESELRHDIIIACWAAQDAVSDFKWNCLRVKPNGISGFSEVAFQYSPDFDTADEPQVVRTVVCIPKNLWWSFKRDTVHKNLIWHHKWMWVNPDYNGFDYEASKARSALWKPHVSKKELSKIGNKVYWESIKHRWEKS
jgi:hypothetical protein